MNYLMEEFPVVDKNPALGNKDIYLLMDQLKNKIDVNVSGSNPDFSIHLNNLNATIPFSFSNYESILRMMGNWLVVLAYIGSMLMILTKS